MSSTEFIRIGCLTDGRTVYIEPAGKVDLRWFARFFPEVTFTRNDALNRDEINYSEPAYRAFLDSLRREGWEVVGAGASETEETLHLVRKTAG